MNLHGGRIRCEDKKAPPVGRGPVLTGGRGGTHGEGWGNAIVAHNREPS